MSNTATFVADVSHNFSGRAAVFRMYPPLDGHEYVVASAAVAMFSGPETYLFPCDKDGNVSDWLELDGSYRGGLDHDTALNNAGYEVVRAN